MGHDDHLEGAEADELDHVYEARQVAPAEAEARPETDHRRYPVVASDDSREPQEEHPGDRAEYDGGHRRPEAEAGHEERAREEHEQPDAEVGPQDEVVEEAEHAVAFEDGLDPELGSRQIVARSTEHLGLGRHQNATYPLSASSIGWPASTNWAVPVGTRSVTSPRTVRPPSIARADASSSTSRGSKVNRSS